MQLLRPLVFLSSRNRNASLAALVFLFLVGAPIDGRLNAADPAFVGVLSILEDAEVQDQLELSESQRTEIEQLIRQRESDGLAMAMKAKAWSTEERDRQQAVFVTESEQRGLAILSEPQQAMLRQLRLQREGMQSLVREEVAADLKLTDDQRKRVAELLEERQRYLDATEDEARQRILRSSYDLRIKKLLDENQKQAWTTLSTAPETNSPSNVAVDPSGSSDPSASAVQSIAPSSETTGAIAAADGKLQFNFRYAPWKTVLEWFAEQAELSLVMDAPPPGSFNLSEPRTYEPEEALDVINSVLLTKGYTLVRRESMLMVINLEDGIPPNLVTTVPSQQLDDRGEFELVSTLFRLGKVEPEVAELEIRKLLGPQGDLQMLGAAKQMFVTETAGRLRTIRDVLRAMEDPDATEQQVTTFALQHIVPEEAFAVLQQMLGLPEGMNASADGSLRMATDILGERIMVTGPADKVKQIGEILKLVDMPSPQTETGAGGILASPQLVVYPVVAADSESVLLVLQTLLTDEEVRLAIDPKTGNLVALALPSQHALINATLQQMQQGGQSIEVIRLNYVDPQIAVLAINQLFGVGEEGNADAPKVNADISSSQLLVRGSDTQIEQIRTLLNKMGEDNEYLPVETTAGNVRVLPLSSADAQATLDQLQQIWPAVRANRIRTVVPSAVIRAVRPPADKPSDPPNPESGRPSAKANEREPGNLRESRTGALLPGRAKPEQRDDRRRQVTPKAGDKIETGVGRHLPLTDTLLAQVPQDSLLGLESLLGGDVTRTLKPRSEAELEPLDEDDEPGADIVVAIGASGLIIASRDKRALNEFEQLVNSLSSNSSSTSRDFAVFYLKHVTADSANKTLTSVLNGDAAASDSGGGGLLDLAGLGGGGDLMGSLLGLGGGGGGDTGGLTASGSFSIVPEPRLNLLVVQANATDMQLIEQLLEIIDQRTSPEAVETVPQPRLVPILHASAEQVASVIREVFASQLASGPGQQRQPSPEDFVRALRGGRGGGGGQAGGSEEDKKQLTVSVDTRANQLVIGAPDDLFAQILTLVRQLDQGDPDSAEISRVITLDRANPELVQRALSLIIGSATGQAPTANGSTGTPSSGSRGSSATGGPSSAAGRGGSPDVQQQIEMFRALRAGGGQGAGGGRGGRGGRGGGGTGGGGRGGQGGGRGGGGGR